MYAIQKKNNIVIFDYLPPFVFNNGINYIFISVTPETLQMLEVCKLICGAQNTSRLRCHTLIGLSFCWSVSYAIYRGTLCVQLHILNKPL